MNLVVDSSVAIKWIMSDAVDENDIDRAVKILSALSSGHVILYQPSHWIVEVMSVIARKAPDKISPTCALLHRTPHTLVAKPETYVHAATIAARLKHHMFDTRFITPSRSKRVLPL